MIRGKSSVNVLLPDLVISVRSRSTQLQTDGSSSLEAAVSSLWGPKSLVNVVPLRLAFTVAVDRFTAPRKRGSHQDMSVIITLVIRRNINSLWSVSVEVQGLISKFSPGCGRMNTDRQFFFVNGRPCVLNKVITTTLYCRSFSDVETDSKSLKWDLSFIQCWANSIRHRWFSSTHRYYLLSYLRMFLMWIRGIWCKCISW